MPRLDRLPSLEVIRGLKGILDFYYWKGIPCVRKWPVIPPSSRSPASLASAQLFGAVVAGYSLLGAVLKELFALHAADQPRTARDLFVSAVLGHLHDHNMSDFLDLLTQATAYLATLANLTHALETIHTDRLLVRGMDQLFSFDSVLAETKADTISAANGHIQSRYVPEGKIWRIYNIRATDITSPTTQHNYTTYHDVGYVEFAQQKAAFAANDDSFYNGLVTLDYNDRIRIYFIGGQAGDTCRIDITGHQMTVET